MEGKIGESKEMRGPKRRIQRKHEAKLSEKHLRD
jgi:hypothetical protein